MNFFEGPDYESGRKAADLDVFSAIPPKTVETHPKETNTISPELLIVESVESSPTRSMHNTHVEFILSSTNKNLKLKALKTH